MRCLVNCVSYNLLKLALDSVRRWMIFTLDEELVAIASEELGAFCRNRRNAIDASGTRNG